MELILISVAWILGIIMGLYFNKGIALFLICLILIYFVLKRKISNLKKYLILFGIILIISYVRINFLENDFSKKYQNINNEVEVIGTIVSAPKISSYKSTYTLSVEKIDNDSSFKNTKVVLNVKSSNCNLKYGDKVKIYGILQDANVARNEDGFNYKEYLKQKGIYKIISIKKDDVVCIKEKNVSLIFRIVNFTREKIKEKCKSMLPEKEANFLIGVLIGDKLELDEDVKKDFSNSNLSHILAVSGMHVSYVVMGIGFVIEKLKVGKIKGKLITIIFLMFFMLLTGCTPSITRACIMSVYMIVGSILHRRVNSLNSIFFSSIVILIINPYYICDIGFLLSFFGTLGIVLLYPILKKYIKIKKQENIISKIKVKIIEITLVSLSSNIFIFPIVMFYFNTISTLFLISNLLASALIGIIILLGFICIIISFFINPIAQIISIPLKILIDILLQIANIIGNLPFSKIYCITPKIYIIAIYYVFLLLFIIKRNSDFKFRINKKLILVLLIIFISFNFIISKIIPNNLNIYFVDVGQRRLHFNCNTKK